MTSAGEAVGVNTAIIQGAQNLSFSVPMKTVTWVVSQLIQNGRVRRGSARLRVRDGFEPDICAQAAISLVAHSSKRVTLSLWQMR